MCGRFGATFTFREIIVRWNLQRDIPMYAPRFNIAPSQQVPVIVSTDSAPDAKGMQWGLVPWWAKDPAIGNRMINARAETLTEKGAFKNLVDKRRCLVPVDGFYEWRQEGKRKVPMWFYLRGTEPFAFAGLWDLWRKPDGSNLETFTIVTTEPNELMRPVHNRMPVILRREDEEQWLDVSRAQFDKARSVLKPYPAQLMDAHNVSTIVNKPENDTPECIERLSHSETLTPQLSLL
jgi:putative SOS response-associated peptidase YedK